MGSFVNFVLEIGEIPRLISLFGEVFGLFGIYVELIFLDWIGVFKSSKSSSSNTFKYYLSCFLSFASSFGPGVRGSVFYIFLLF
jgi:hypothetical protein